ncbi:MAG: transporter [Cyclobacteriaceae bacterium]|nr:transporter [Cyclobacteriaceae bacterium]
MNKFFTICAIALLINDLANAQGCVAIRQFSGALGQGGQTAISSSGDWNINTNYRYFKSFRHFRGKEEEPDRVANKTEVINYSHAFDLNISYMVNERLFGILTLPFVYNERSSLYEHGRTSRHMSYSSGLADLSFGFGYWLLSNEKSDKKNISIAASIKLPTGNYSATSKFYNVGPEGSSEIRPVDQSIQPGDGGVGAIISTQGYNLLFGSLFLYYDAFYLINPRNTNGTRTFRETLSPLLANESIMSVPDQYALRAGVFAPILSHELSMSLGLRLEGVPVRDLIGESDGFRRPGYIASVEPGLNYMAGNFSFIMSVPIAIIRNRTQSVTDKETTMTSGTYRHGDSAFADYLINVGLALRIPSKKLPVFQTPEFSL